MNSKSGYADRAQEDAGPGTEHTPSKPGHTPTPSLSPPHTHTLWGNMISYLPFSLYISLQNNFSCSTYKQANHGCPELVFFSVLRSATHRDWLARGSEVHFQFPRRGGVWLSPHPRPTLCQPTQQRLWVATFWGVVIFTGDLRWSDSHFPGLTLAELWRRLRPTDQLSGYCINPERRRWALKQNQKIYPGEREWLWEIEKI